MVTIIEKLREFTNQEIIIGNKIKCVSPTHPDEHASMHVYEDSAYCFSCGYYVSIKQNNLATYSIKEFIASKVIDYSQESTCADWIKERGYDSEILKKLKIGYFSIQTWNKLQSEFGKELINTETNYLDKAGRVLLLGRIIIPFTKTYFSARSRDRDSDFKNMFPKLISKELYIINKGFPKIIIYEGETDLIAGYHIWGNEFTHVSLGGVTSGDGAYAKIAKHLKELKAQEYYICFDNDEVGISAKENLIQAFHNINVKLVHSVCFNEKWKDIDELHLELKKDSKKQIEFKKHEYKNIDQVDLFLENKEDIAERFYLSNPYFYDDIGLFWFWNNTLKCYEMKDEYDLMLSLKYCANQKHFQVTKSSFWNDTIKAMKLIGRMHKPLPFNKKWIQLKDKIYDLESKQLFDANPEYFNVNPLPWEYSVKKGSIRIDKLLTEWVGNENLITVKETIALSMIQDYPLHRIVCVTGSGCNGKGVFLTLVRTILGERNVCSTELDKLTKSSFEVSKLYKKLAVMMGETDYSVVQNTGRLKSLSGGDLMSAEFKGKDSFDFVNTALIFISTNTVPATTDKTDGFYRRWLFIDFSNKFKEGNSPLADITPEEYSAFCSELLDLIQPLIKRGRFHNDGDVEHRKAKYEAKSNPFPKFLSENYIKGDINSCVEAYDMFNLFESYLIQRGLRKIAFYEFKKLCEAENIEIEEDREYRDVYNKEIGKFEHKQVRVRHIYNYSLIMNKTNKTDKTAFSSQDLYIGKADLKSVSYLSCLSCQNDPLNADILYQYIKQDIKKEHFMSDFCLLSENSNEIRAILDILVTRGDLENTKDGGWKAILR